METQVLDEINAKLNGFETKVAGIPDAILEAFKPKEDEDPKPKESLSAEIDAELEKGMFEGFSKAQVWGIPVGQALVGGFVAIFGSELIDGFLINQSKTVKGLVKAVAAGVAAQWGGRIIGSTGAKAVALLLAFDAMRDLLPVDEWASKVANQVSAAIPTGGLGDQAGRDVLAQAGKVAGDYYSRSGL